MSALDRGSQQGREPERELEPVVLDDVEIGHELVVAFETPDGTDRVEGRVVSVIAAASTHWRENAGAVLTGDGERYRIMFGGSVQDVGQSSELGFGADLYRSREVATDGGEDMVFVRTTSHGSGGKILHTDRDCSRLDHARGVHTYPRSSFPDDADICRYCSGEADHFDGGCGGPWQALDDADPDLVTDGGQHEPITVGDVTRVCDLCHEQHETVAAALYCCDSRLDENSAPGSYLPPTVVDDPADPTDGGDEGRPRHRGRRGRWSDMSAEQRHPAHTEPYRVTCETCGDEVEVGDRLEARTAAEEHLDEHDQAAVVRALPVGEHGVDPDALVPLGGDRGG